MGLIVVRPGLATTVQDLGRPGHRDVGVPSGGAFDRAALALANALVDNPPDAAALEMTLLGGTFEATCPLALAWAGAPMNAVVETPRGIHDLPATPGSFQLSPGERLRFGGARVGARSYLAVRGGWRTSVALGSRSSERRLEAGDVLPACATEFWPTRSLAPTPLGVDDKLSVRVTGGLDAVLKDYWGPTAFRVASESDRMGLRLIGPVPGVPVEAERLSVPVLPGSVQVAGDRLIVLGVAGGTMGGYPHVAQVIAADLDSLGQARPGTVVQFLWTSVEKARMVDRARREAQGRLLLRVRSAVSDRLGRGT